MEAGIDLLVVDEAHHLRRPKGHPGNEAYRAIAPIAALEPARPAAHRHAAGGRRPRLLPAAAAPAPRGVSGGGVVRRAPRPPRAAAALHQLDAPGRTSAACRRACRCRSISARTGWEASERLVRHLRAQAADNPLAKRRKADRVFRALASPAALLGGAGARRRGDRRARRRGRARGPAGALAGRAGRPLDGAGREDAGLRGPPRDARSAQGRRSSGRGGAPASSTRSSRPSGGTSRWRSSGSPRGRRS